MEPVIILINPWIYDFAAYDLWAKPLGLLYVAAYLKQHGFKIHLIDCLDIYHPEMESLTGFVPPKRRSYGTGKFWKEEITKPSSLINIARTYSRYGIAKKIFIRELKKIKKPSAIFVTSLMTYWYPGVLEAIKLAKVVYPDTPVILGGIYSKLCRQHAIQFSGADYVASEVDLNNLEYILKILNRFHIPVPANYPSKGALPFPSFDMLNRIDYVCILTSTGCPYNCHYCASHFLQSHFQKRDPEHVLTEIEFWHKIHGVRDFAFYDDALLIDFESHMGIVLEEIVRKDLDLRFHTPNAIHVRMINSEVAGLFARSGFRTIRLGLETVDHKIHDDLDRKVYRDEFERAVNHLKKAGFSKRDIGAYILMGLPEQTIESVLDTIKFVGRKGASPYLAEYSPLPHTALWKKAVEHSEYDIANEPLFHNNTLIPCWDEDQRKRVPEVKRMVRKIRQD